MKYFKAIVTVTKNSSHSNKFLEANNLTTSTPIKVILENEKLHMCAGRNPQFVWPSTGLLFTKEMEEIKIIILGKELAEKEVGELIHE